MLSKLDKTFAALLVSFISGLALQFFNFEISLEMQATIVSLLTGLFVWLVPNKPADPAP